MIDRSKPFWEYVYQWRSELTWMALGAFGGVVYRFFVTEGMDVGLLATWQFWSDEIVPATVRAVLAGGFAAFTGGFRPQFPTGPTVPTIDEEIGVSPRRVARPELPDD